MLFISTLLAKAFTILIFEASAWNVPFRPSGRPSSFEAGDASFIGLMQRSLLQKKDVTSITMFFEL